MSATNILYKLDNGERTIDCEESVEAGDYIFINSDGKAEKADGSSIHKMPCIGRVTRILNEGPDLKCSFKKDLIEPDYEQVSPRDVFFISATNPGEITDKAPEGKGTVIQHVGFGLAKNEILINIDPTNIIIRS